ncbi:MAG: hypothetical protein ACFB9M_05865 [Myxococcota bacterium]
MRGSLFANVVRARFLGSLGAAVLGALLGWAYGWYWGHDTGSSRIPLQMYGLLGSVLGIMALRLATLVRAMVRDFFFDRD